MSILSGTGQTPSIFSSGGGTPLNPALSVALPLQNNGSEDDGGAFTNYNTLNLQLLPNTTYRVFITLSCIPDTGFVQIATLDSGVVFFSFHWQSGTTSYFQQLIFTSGQSLGTLVAQGQIISQPEPFNGIPYTLNELSLSANWSGSGSSALDLLTAGQLYLEPV
jgi:hypothetical protein